MQQSLSQTADLPFSPKRPSVWQRLLRTMRKNPITGLGIFIVLALIMIAIFAPLLAPYDPYATDPRFDLEPPSRVHWFGTDTFGSDIFSRVLYGARLDLMIAFGAVGIALIVGCLLGAVAGYWEGVLGDIIMRVVELLQAFPSSTLR